MEFCNNAAVHSGGDIWFSDSSPRYGIDRWKADLVEDTAHRPAAAPGAGRRASRWCSTGSRFANGVALAADESYVAVAETGARTVVRHWLTGPRAGERDLLADDLPGYPDNIARGSDGLVWVTIASPTDPVRRAADAAHAAAPARWRLPSLQPGRATVR